MSFRFCRDSVAVFKHSSVHLCKCVDVAMIVVCVHTYKHNIHGIGVGKGTALEGHIFKFPRAHAHMRT